MSMTEQELRREAIRRRRSGERRGAICQELGRSPRWFDKWWAAFRRDPQPDFRAHSRAPQPVSSVLSPQLEQLVTSRRHHFEAAPHGLIGARAIRGQRHEWPVTPLPS
jgi:transposase-like protein